MSRSFTKSVLNFMDFPNADASLLDGAITAFSLFANIRTLDNGTPQNFLFCVPNPGSASVGFAAYPSASAGVNRLNLRGRATATDSTRSVTATATFALNQWVHFGGQIDWANDTFYPVTNGVMETIASTGWTAAAFDAGAGTGKFRIGQSSLAAASLTASNALDAQLAHVAYWVPTTLMSAGEWAALAQGVSPFFVRPADLKIYRQLLGIEDTEPDLVSHGLVTIAGSVPAGSSDPNMNDIFEPDGSVPEIPSTGIGAVASRVLQMRKAA